LENPVVPADRLYGFPNHYKAKLRSSGYRLVYEVEEMEITVYVIAIGKREDSAVYQPARKRGR
jgi:mRNA interferase RelE/StbE